MTPDELAETGKNLLKYCEIDTFAMVKVWEAFKEAEDKNNKQINV